MDKNVSVEVVDEGHGPVTFENASASEMTPALKRFYTVKDIMHDLSCSQSYACKIIREINDRLKANGLMTFRGRVLKKAYLQATGGE